MLCCHFLALFLLLIIRIIFTRTIYLAPPSLSSISRDFPQDDSSLVCGNSPSDPCTSFPSVIAASSPGDTVCVIRGSSSTGQFQIKDSSALPFVIPHSLEFVASWLPSDHIENDDKTEDDCAGSAPMSESVLFLQLVEGDFFRLNRTRSSTFSPPPSPLSAVVNDDDDDDLNLIIRGLTFSAVVGAGGRTFIGVILGTPTLAMTSVELHECTFFGLPASAIFASLSTSSSSYPAGPLSIRVEKTLFWIVEYPKGDAIVVDLWLRSSAPSLLWGGSSSSVTVLHQITIRNSTFRQANRGGLGVRVGGTASVRNRVDIELETLVFEKGTQRRVGVSVETKDEYSNVSVRDSKSRFLRMNPGIPFEITGKGASAISRSSYFYGCGSILAQSGATFECVGCEFQQSPLSAYGGTLALNQSIFGGSAVEVFEGSILRVFNCTASLFFQVIPFVVSYSRAWFDRLVLEDCMSVTTGLQVIGSDLYIRNSQILRNTGGSGGLLYYTGQPGTVLDLEEVTFHRNFSPAASAGVMVMAPDDLIAKQMAVRIVNCSFTSNKAAIGGAGSFQWPETVRVAVLEGNYFFNNSLYDHPRDYGPDFASNMSTVRFISEKMGELLSKPKSIMERFDWIMRGYDAFGNQMPFDNDKNAIMRVNSSHQPDLFIGQDNVKDKTLIHIGLQPPISEYRFKNIFVNGFFRGVSSVNNVTISMQIVWIKGVKKGEVFGDISFEVPLHNSLMLVWLVFLCISLVVFIVVYVVMETVGCVLRCIASSSSFKKRRRRRKGYQAVTAED